MSSGPVLVRPAAVAGSFYPRDPVALHDALRRAFAAARPPEPGAQEVRVERRTWLTEHRGRRAAMGERASASAGGAAPVATQAPKALVVPHAGYPYSGPIAASAYLRLAPARHDIRRVVLLGPSHHVPLDGLAVSSADAFATPFGLVPIDGEARRAALELPAVRIDDDPHALEHSLEVQLPFLQTVLDSFELLPLAVGRCRAGDVATVLDLLWGGPETLIVVSTDLSHYLGYAEARAVDRRTADAVTALEPGAIADTDACGAYPLRGLLLAARARGLSVDELDVRNSGETAGDRTRVVGYGAFALA
jgi:AmmeMemoRadiSam system protein B